VSESKGKRSRSTYNSSGGSILGSVTGAHELIVGGRPWHDTSQMSAHSVKSVGLKGLVLLYNKVGGISLESLGEGAV